MKFKVRTSEAPLKEAQKHQRQPGKIILVGSSTGGVHILTSIIEGLDIFIPPILIAQHMPEDYTGAFADHLNHSSQVYVREAQDGDLLYNGHVYISPGDHHILLKKEKGLFSVEINQSAPVNLFRPSVDVLYESAVPWASRKLVAIILSGMGNDGARGMLKLREAGAFTIAQDESSSTVFGMPREAIKTGAVEQVKDIDEIVQFINSLNDPPSLDEPDE